MQTKLPDGSVMVAGSCGRDPEFKRVGANDSRKCSVSLSVGRRAAEGRDRGETIWCNVVAWHDLAQVLAQARKGEAVFAVGRLQSRDYNGKTCTDLVAEFVSCCQVAPERTTFPPAAGMGKGAWDETDSFAGLTTEDSRLPF